MSSTLVELRNSERSTFTQCPQKWEWAYVDRIKAKTPSPALRFGSLIHGALEEFYLPGIKRGPKPAETFQRLFEEDMKVNTKMGFRDEDGEWHEAGNLGTVMLEAYFDRYGKDDRWRVLATEIPFRVEVTDPETGRKFIYVGVIDGIWLDRESGKRRDIWVVDHKTTRDDPTLKGDALVLDEQTGSYWSYGVDYLIEQGILDSTKGLSGMMFNFLRKGKPDERPKNAAGQALNKPTKDDIWIYFENNGLKLPEKTTVEGFMAAVAKKPRHLKAIEQLGAISKTQPAPLFHREPVWRAEYDKQMARDRIIAQARLMHYMRTGKFPVYKVPGTLHNPHCKWCEYRDMCEVHETGGDWQTMHKTLFKKWEPYAQHEVNDGEKMA